MNTIETSNRTFNKAKLSQIKLAIFDVDGVLTDSKLYFTDEGQEFKSFNAKDGLGMKLLLDNGIDIAIITGRKSLASRARLKDNLGIQHYHEGCLDKVAKLKEIQQQLSIDFSQMLYVGDDLIDLGVMNLVGVSVAVSDAENIVKETADIVLSRKGGEGAVREICDTLLQAKECFEDIINCFQQGEKYSN